MMVDTAPARRRGGRPGTFDAPCRDSQLSEGMLTETGDEAGMCLTVIPSIRQAIDGGLSRLPETTGWISDRREMERIRQQTPSIDAAD